MDREVEDGAEMDTAEITAADGMVAQGEVEEKDDAADEDRETTARRLGLLPLLLFLSLKLLV